MSKKTTQTMSAHERAVAASTIDIVSEFFGPQYAEGLEQHLSTSVADFTRELERRIPASSPRHAAMRAWRAGEAKLEGGQPRTVAKHPKDAYKGEGITPPTRGVDYDIPHDTGDWPTMKELGICIALLLIGATVAGLILYASLEAKGMPI